MGAIIGVEYATDVGGYSLFEVLGWDVSLGILLEMELATKPRTGIKGGP